MSSTNASEPFLPKGGVVRNQGRNVMLSVCSFILVTEFCERLAYYGLTGSLTTYFTHLKFSGSSASSITSLFSTVNYLTPMLGAWLADSVLGRYRTILYFTILYAIGMGLCVFGAVPHHEQTWLFMLGLFVGVCFGSGGIKSSVVVLGADQFDPRDADQVKQKESFFSFFYWAVNIGATVAFGFLAYLAVNGIGAIPQDWGYFFSFLIPAVAFVIGSIVFVIGRSRYHETPPKGSELAKFFSVVGASVGKTKTGMAVMAGAFMQVPAFALSTIAIFVSPESNEKAHLALSYTAMTLILIGCGLMIVFSRGTAWMDAARRTHGGSFSEIEVNNASDVMRLFPYLGFFIMFWAIYNQMSGNFVLQACQMDVRVGGGQYSGAQLSLIDSGVILAFIPVLDRVIYPGFARIGSPLTLMRRIGVGFFMTALAMGVAGYVEILRRNAPQLVPAEQAKCAAEGSFMSDFSVYLQIPQYMLIGLGEILAAVTAYELFYSQVPESMRSVCQGLNLLTTSLGGMVTTSINNIFSAWVTDDLNEGHLEYVFFAMGVLMLLNLAAFMYVSQSFVLKELPAQEDVYVDDEEQGRAPFRKALDVQKVIINDAATEEDETTGSEWMSPQPNNRSIRARDEEDER